MEWLLSLSRDSREKDRDRDKVIGKIGLLEEECNSNRRHSSIQQEKDCMYGRLMEWSLDDIVLLFIGVRFNYHRLQLPRLVVRGWNNILVDNPFILSAVPSTAKTLFCFSRFEWWWDWGWSIFPAAPAVIIIIIIRLSRGFLLFEWSTRPPKL
jgi:hypothetical protein